MIPLKPPVIPPKTPRDPCPETPSDSPKCLHNDPTCIPPVITPGPLSDPPVIPRDPPLTPPSDLPSRPSPTQEVVGWRKERWWSPALQGQGGEKGCQEPSKCPRSHSGSTQTTQRSQKTSVCASNHPGITETTQQPQELSPGCSWLPAPQHTWTGVLSLYTSLSFKPNLRGKLCYPM